MSVTETQLKQAVASAIRGVMVDSKYHNEPISMGQAVVTHHFLAQLQNSQRNNSS